MLSLANNQALGTGAPTNTGSVDANGVTIANSIMVDSKTTQCRCPPAPRPKPG
jgi:hypothetical protein